MTTPANSVVCVCVWVVVCVSVCVCDSVRMCGLPLSRCQLLVPALSDQVDLRVRACVHVCQCVCVSLCVCECVSFCASHTACERVCIPRTTTPEGLLGGPVRPALPSIPATSH